MLKIEKKAYNILNACNIKKMRYTTAKSLLSKKFRLDKKTAGELLSLLAKKNLIKKNRKTIIIFSKKHQSLLKQAL